ncbi:MAG: DUF3822 family protein [Flavobacteriales bacterium]|nr:DUF3822 family protein [Flavobacteriales bacterium]
MQSGQHTISGYDNALERGHHLSILIGQGVSAWVAHDLRTLRPAAMAWGVDADALRSMELPEFPRTVTYVSLPEWSTLVPDGALEPAAAADHLSLVHGPLGHQLVRDEPVTTLGASCLYVHDDSHARAVLERFPNARSLPLQAVLLRGAQSRSITKPTLLLHRGKDRSDIALAHGQQVLLSSSYPTRSAEDLLYFCLLAAERCQLGPEELMIRTGGTHLTAEERALLHRYFQDHATAVVVTWSDDRHQDIPADLWLAAFDQFPCVS